MIDLFVVRESATSRGEAVLPCVGASGGVDESPVLVSSTRSSAIGK